MATKTECIKWLLDHMIDDPTSVDFAVTDVWTILSSLIEYLKKESNERVRAGVLYDIRSLIKGVIYADS